MVNFIYEVFYLITVFDFKVLDYIYGYPNNILLWWNNQFNKKANWVSLKNLIYYLFQM